ASADDIAQTRAAALQAYAAADYESYLQYVQQLADALPNHPGIALRLAAAQARSGHTTEALATLQDIAAAGVTVDLAGDERNAGDFAALAGDAQFDAWKQRIAANAQAIAKSKPWHRFADAGLLSEDVSYSDKEQAFYVSSVLEHRLV